MAERQQALARVVLQDPAVTRLSSFIGVDGSNTTLNSGRMLINLKPLEERRAHATEIIRRMQQRGAKLEGITLYMQPVQDLTIEDRVSRTQYQFSVEDADAAELGRMGAEARRSLREAVPATAPTWRATCRTRAAGLRSTIDRDTASRLGHHAAAIDDALYNAFGQRLISTIFTQANQYRVVLEVQARVPGAARPGARVGPEAVRPSSGVPQRSQPVRCRRWRASRSATPLVINHQGQFPAVTLSFNLAPGASLGEAVEAIEAASEEIGTAGQHADAASRARRLRSSASLDNTLLLILAAIVTMYIVLGVLYESYIHPITILSTLPSAGVGALLALMIYLGQRPLGIIAHHRHHPA